MTNEEYKMLGLPTNEEIYEKQLKWEATDENTFSRGALWMRDIAAEEIRSLRRTQPRRCVIDELTIRTAYAIEREKAALKRCKELELEIIALKCTK